MSVSFNEHAPQPDLARGQKRTLAEVNVRIVNCSCSISEPRSDQVHVFPVDIELAANQVQYHMMEDVGEPAGLQGQSSTSELTGRILSPLRWIQTCSAAVSSLLATGHAFLNPSAKQFSTWCAKQHTIRTDTLPVAFHDQGTLLAVARASGAVDVYGLANVHMPRACDLLDASMGTDSGTSGLSQPVLPRLRPPCFPTVRSSIFQECQHHSDVLAGAYRLYTNRIMSPKNFVQAPHVLQAASQRKIHDQAWQPLSDCTLAVAHGGGVSLWRHIDQSRSPAMHRLHLQKGTLSPYIQHTLPWPSTAAATALAWHPKGTMLAAVSLHDNCLFIWDASLVRQEPERVRLPGHAGTHLLRWSPCGHYLFVDVYHQLVQAQGRSPATTGAVIINRYNVFGAQGLNDGTFCIFETLTWRSEAWSHVSCGYLVDVTWSTKASPPALILCCSGQLASLHFTEEAPSLDAQLMPLAAPQIFEQEVTSSGIRDPWDRAARRSDRTRRPLDGQEVVCGMVWDSQKERLLVSLCGSHPLAGHMLLYTTVQSPVLSAVCLGPIFLPHCRGVREPEPARGFLGFGGGQSTPAQEVRTGVRGTVALQCRSPLGTLVAVRCGEQLVTVIPVAVQDATAHIGYSRRRPGMDSHNGSTTTLF